jgi:Calcineurin-like phosphoesterase
MPDPAKVLATVRRAAELFRNTPGRVGSIVTLQDADEVLVVGDLHGNLSAFRHVLPLADLARNPRRHLVLQELVHELKVDPDEGRDLSHRLVDLVCALKCQHPDRVHLILGNHELSELTGRPIAKGGVYLNVLFRQGLEASYGASAGAIFAAYQQLFAALPLAVRTPNRVFLCHTIPDAADLDGLDLEVLRTGVWPPEAMARGGTIYALTWGRDTQPETADRFAALVDAELFITGHQPCDRGFRRANHRQVIIDGTDPYPTACLFRAREPATIEDLLGGVRRLPS